MKPSICLVSPAHLANNPRLVKEADALHSAGNSVHVVCGRYYPAIDEFDAALLAKCRWPVSIVNYAPSRANLGARMLHKLARVAVTRLPRPALSLAALAHHRAHPALVRAAIAVRASLYVGHTLAGLAAAASAARAVGARYAFDAEDFHPAETTDSLENPASRAAIDTLGRRLIPGAVHVSAASPLIGSAYAEQLELATPPLTVLNVFPLREAPSSAHPGTSNAPEATRRLYWFSQTIGPGRGLEELLPVLARLRTPVSLHLRGLPAAGFPESLRSAAQVAGYRGEIEFLPMGHAEDMVRLAADYDLGLSLEQTTPLNRDLCLTNKVFTYLLAGIPVALTPTRAQLRLASELGEAAVLLDAADPAGNAARLDALLADTDRLKRARAQAWNLGQSRFNWEAEQVPLVAALGARLPETVGTPARP